MAPDGNGSESCKQNYLRTLSNSPLVPPIHIIIKSPQCFIPESTQGKEAVLICITVCESYFQCWFSRKSKIWMWWHTFQMPSTQDLSWGLEFNSNIEKLLLSQISLYFRGSRFSQCFILFNSSPLLFQVIFML